MFSAIWIKFMAVCALYFASPLHVILCLAIALKVISFIIIIAFFLKMLKVLVGGGIFLLLFYSVVLLLDAVDAFTHHGDIGLHRS